ncbi:hypothetical protein KFE25_002524 [Diacronema lutheri]|uniref:Transmembrane protein n=1 Tax=Diacronema lutheri TaxID=2081491 RepID=A0A8J5X9L1_DIALT|nr:hypothetical protein KFE25_002524 [Diacronema lutheri]
MSAGDGLTSHYVSIDELDGSAQHSGTPAFVPQQRHSMFLLVSALSTLEMVAAASVCARGETCHGAPAWGVALGLLSALICAAYLFAANSRADTAEAVLEPVVLFLFWWWVAGVSTLTFYGPFVEVGNGFCATWAALVVVTILLYGSSSAFRGTLDDAWAKMQLSAHVELLALASVVELVAASATCARGTCNDGSGWAITVGCVSLATCAWAWISSSVPAARASSLALAVRSPVFATAMSGWWLLAVCTLTLSSPFEHAGNGFLSTWAALYSSVMLVFSAYEVQLPSASWSSDTSGRLGAAVQHAPPPPHAVARPPAGPGGAPVQRPVPAAADVGGVGGMGGAYACAPPGCPPGFPTAGMPRPTAHHGAPPAGLGPGAPAQRHEPARAAAPQGEPESVGTGGPQQQVQAQRKPAMAPTAHATEAEKGALLALRSHDDEDGDEGDAL